MVAENEQFAFLVTHVEAEGQFLKIWAQTDERIIQSVASVLIPLQETFDYYGPPNIIALSRITPNTCCCARGINNDFSRVKILNIRSDSTVLVQFIDYGNIQYIPINNIRLLDCLKEANYLASIPNAATFFVLADITPIGGTWLDDVVKQIRSILVNNKFCGVYKIINNYKALKFLMMEKDFGKLLVDKNMAMYSSSCANISSIMPPISLVPLRTPHSKNMAQQHWRMPTSNCLPNQNSIQKTNSFKAIQLEIGSVHEIQISYVEEGPQKFSVQLLESIPELNRMMEKINSQAHQTLQEPPIAGRVCLGLQANHNRLCRVVLNSPGDTSCKVYYADYGHHETLPFTAIYQIPDEFVIDNIFSIRFTLSGIMDWIVTQEMKDYFKDLVQNKNLKLRVCKGPMSPLTQYCDLFANGRNVKDLLSEAFPEMCINNYPDSKHLQRGATETVFITYVESPMKFFIQIEKDVQPLDEIMDQIAQVSETVSKINFSQIHPNMPCMALYDLDKKWYRASVLNIVDDNKAKVFYVDYGNEEIVPINNLRKIPMQLVSSLPRQAICCSLHGFKAGSMDKEITKTFEGLVLEERLNLTVQNILSNTISVNLFDGESGSSKNIGELLKAQFSTNYEASTKERSPDQSRSMRSRNQRCDTKAQAPLDKKQKPKNKNVKTRDNWSSNWEKDGQSHKTNNYETPKSKFRKDNENQQRYENRYGKGNADYTNTSQNRYQSDSSINDRFQRGNSRNPYESSDHSGRSNKGNQSNRLNINSRLERNFTPEKVGNEDWDSQISGKQGNRNDGRRCTDNQWKQNGSTSHHMDESWDDEEQVHDSSSKTCNGNFTQAELKSSSGFKQTKSSPKQISSTLTTKIPPPNITVGAVKNCAMVFYNNPSNFYVHLCPDHQELNTIMDQIANIYTNGGKVLQASDIQIDLQCIAQYSVDNQWYRAVIKSFDATTASVYFVDYGNNETISFDRIKQIEPDLLKLPAQAVPCKLFCPEKFDWTKDESDLFYNEIGDLELEFEFVKEESGLYDVLIKDITQTIKFINEKFVDGIDLVKEKQTVRNKVRPIVDGETVSLPEYISPDEKWLENNLYLETKCDVTLTWFINPENFYCQLTKQQKEFHDMMIEIQTAYAKRDSSSVPLKVGSSVLARLKDDGVLYRAEIKELNNSKDYVVQYVDYGDIANVSLNDIYLVERKFMRLPKQAILCGLSNIAPEAGSTWSNPKKFSNIFESGNLECIFHTKQDKKYIISLIREGKDVASVLVDNKLAVKSVAISQATNVLENTTEKQTVPKIDLPEDPTGKPTVPRIDLKLLEGQTLCVKVSSIESVDKFYVQFCTAEACQEIVDAFMATQDSEVMPRLLSHEVCLGAGCLVNSKGKWRRGVVISFENEYEVRLIDTGELENISLQCMLGLSGQLAGMQNQAIECALFDVPSSPINENIKQSIIGKDVKIFVEKVECSRLIVRLFDTNGNTLKMVNTQKIQSINPVCNMQILSSTHEVVITYMENSNSIWLQRVLDKPLEEKLLNSMYSYYSELKEQIIPKVNQLYASLSSDGNWYRVKVTHVEDTVATVILIDYGNIENIYINNFRTLKDQFYLPHQLGIQVSLTVSLEGSDDVQLELLEPLIKDKRFLATFYNVNRKWIAELTENGEKISDKLISLKNTVQEATSVQNESTEVEIEDMVVGKIYIVEVSHVDNPNQLWIQRKEDLTKIRSLHEELQKVALSCTDCNGVPEEKSLCLAMYTLDNLWYRAEVLDADNEITTVRFIDYGNTDVVNTNQLKQLPEKWKSVKKYAIKCKLDIVPSNSDEWPEEVCKRFSDLVYVSTQALVIALTPMRIDLFIDSKSVSQTLVEEKLAENVPTSVDLIEDVEEVQLQPDSAFLCNFVSVDEFWVQQENWVSDLRMIDDRLSIASLLPSVTEFNEGQMCVAQYGNEYYRATILSHNEEGTNVYYIDYGNSDVVHDLKIIPSDLAEIRPLSRKCCLAKPDGVEHWPEGINEEFEHWAAYGKTAFVLDVIEEGETCLVRLIYDSKDVAIELLEKCAKVNQLVDNSASENVEEIIEDTKEIAENVKEVVTEDIVAQHEIVRDVEFVAQNEAVQDEEFVTQGADEFAEQDVELPVPTTNVSVTDDVQEMVTGASINESQVDLPSDHMECEQYKCIVSYTNSPSEFWIQTKMHYVDVDHTIDRLLHAETFDKAIKLTEGKILAAKFHEDNQWYRSKILSHGECGTEVHYMDYGNLGLVESEEDLRELPDDLILLPPLASKCSLKLPEGVQDWSRSACKTFNELTANGTAEFQFEILDSVQVGSDQILQLSLFYENKNILEILLNNDLQNSNICEKNEDLLQSDNEVISNFEAQNLSTSTEVQNTSEVLEQETSVVSNIDEILVDEMISDKQILVHEETEENHTEITANISVNIKGQSEIVQTTLAESTDTSIDASIDNTSSFVIEGNIAIIDVNNPIVPTMVQAELVNVNGDVVLEADAIVSEQ